MNKSCALANYDACGFITFTTYCDPRNDANGGRESAEIRRVGALHAPGGRPCSGWEKKMEKRALALFKSGGANGWGGFPRPPRVGEKRTHGGGRPRRATFARGK